MTEDFSVNEREEPAPKTKIGKQFWRWIVRPTVLAGGVISLINGEAGRQGHGASMLGAIAAFAVVLNWESVMEFTRHD